MNSVVVLEWQYGSRVVEKRGDMPANGASGACGASGVLQPRVEFQTSRAFLATRTRPASLIPLVWELSPASQSIKALIFFAAYGRARAVEKGKKGR